jgi:VWFA-related protein
MRLLAACTTAMSLALAQAAGGQHVSDQRTSFPTAVEEVLVDVVVADRDGNPVGALTRDDFVVTEDGEPQAVLSFEAVDVASQAPRDPLAALPTVSANPAAGGRSPGRTFFLLYDDVRMTPAQGEAARRALSDFLRTRVEDGDNLLFVTTSGSVWWGARVADGREDVAVLIDRLKGRFSRELLPDQMSDAEAYRIVVQRDAEAFEHVLRRYKRLVPSPGVPPQDDTGFLNGTECDPRKNPDGSVDMQPGLVCDAARTTHLEAVAHLRDTLGFLERGLEALAGVRGRKAAILVSPGFHHDVELAEFQRVAVASQRANAPVYFLDARGLAELPLEMSAQFGQPIPPGDISLAFRDSREAAAGAEVIAHDTGGSVVQNTNDLTKGLRRIADEARRYYLVGYSPTNPARDGTYRKIQVTLAPRAPDREGWEIRARRGYYAPKDGEAVRDPGAPVREALVSPFDLSGLPVRLAAYAFEEKTAGFVRCLLVGEVAVGSLRFREEEGRALASLDFAFTTTRREGGSTTEHAQRVDMKLLPATRETLLRDGYVVTHEVDLPAGVHQVRMVVRDLASGRVGSVMHRIDVPEPDSFHLSTPLVSDALEPVPRGTPPRPAPIARREFTARGRVFLSLDVFGAERGDVTGRPRVSMGYEVIRPDGEVLTRQDGRSIEPTTEGLLHCLVGFTLGDAEAGEYRIEGQVADEQTGKVLLFTEPFRARPPEPPARGNAAAGPPGP